MFCICVFKRYCFFIVVVLFISEDASEFNTNTPWCKKVFWAHHIRQNWNYLRRHKGCWLKILFFSFSRTHFAQKNSDVDFFNHLVYFEEHLQHNCIMINSNLLLTQLFSFFLFCLEFFVSLEKKKQNVVGALQSFICIHMKWWIQFNY